MADVKKIATRESYGNALAECGAEFSDLVVLDADLQELPRQAYLRKHFLTAISTVVLRSVI